MVPIEVTRPELGRRRVAAIRNTDRAAHTESPLGEVQAVARDAADAIERHPFDELGINAALQDKIFEQSPHVVFGEGSADSGL
jgi:hypothetical protein